MKDGLERVLTYLPHMSAYQLLLFLFCYYGYMGVATAVAGNIFYQYRIRCLRHNRTTTLPTFAAHLSSTSKTKSVQTLPAPSSTMQHKLTLSARWPFPILAIHVVRTIGQLKVMSVTWWTWRTRVKSNVVLPIVQLNSVHDLVTRTSKRTTFTLSSDKNHC